MHPPEKNRRLRAALTAISDARGAVWACEPLRDFSEHAVLKVVDQHLRDAENELLQLVEKRTTGHPSAGRAGSIVFRHAQQSSREVTAASLRYARKR